MENVDPLGFNIFVHGPPLHGSLTGSMMDYRLYDYRRNNICYIILFTDQAIVMVFDKHNLLTPYWNFMCVIYRII